MRAERTDGRSIGLGSKVSRTWRRDRGEDGASLVEFALIMPVLFLILFGIIEFGWSFGQYSDVRHGAREGMRLAAVNADPGGSEPTREGRIAAETCRRMDLTGNVGTSVFLERTGTTPGSEITVRVSKPVEQLTNFLSFALSGRVLTSTIQTRAEDDLLWDNTYALSSAGYSC